MVQTLGAGHGHEECSILRSTDAEVTIAARPINAIAELGIDEGAISIQDDCDVDEVLWIDDDIGGSGEVETGE